MKCGHVRYKIGRVKCWSSTEGLRQKEVLERETGMVYNAKTTTTTTTTTGIFRELRYEMRACQILRALI